jgi:hypothetical protein
LPETTIKLAREFLNYAETLHVSDAALNEPKSETDYLADDFDCLVGISLFGRLADRRSPSEK